MLFAFQINTLFTTQQSKTTVFISMLSFHFIFLFFGKYLLKKFCLLPHLFSTISADFPQLEIQKQVSTINLPLSSQFAYIHNLIRISIFYISLLFTFLQVFKFLQIMITNIFIGFILTMFPILLLIKKVKALVCVFK